MSANKKQKTNGDAADAGKLHPDLQKKLEQARAARGFDVDKWIDQKTDMFNDYMKKCGLKACCISLSGGVDSAVTLGLCKRAQSKPGSPIQRVIAVAQPIHSSAWAKNRAIEAAKALNTEIVCIDQTELHNQLSSLVDGELKTEGKSFAKGQLRSYMRTPVGYYVAQLLSQDGNPCIVMGTGNRDEDGYLLYYCKAGDGVVDVQLIADIHKSEVFKVGAAVGVPESILVAPPSADLWDGQTDEEELGFSYDFIELFTNPFGDARHFNDLTATEQSAFKGDLSADGLKEFEKCGKAAEAVHNRNKHKLNSPMNIDIY